MKYFMCYWTTAFMALGFLEMDIHCKQLQEISVGN